MVVSRSICIVVAILLAACGSGSGTNKADTGDNSDGVFDVNNGVPDTDERPILNVLFIGNSYTSANNLPDLFKQLADSKNYNVSVRQVTPGGYRFEAHASNIATLNAISSEQWDVVVLQNQSQVPGWRPGAVSTYSLPHAQTLVNAIEANNSDTDIVYYATWGREHGDADNCDYYSLVCTFSGHTQALLDGYSIYQNATGGTLGLVGTAWEMVVDDNSAPFSLGDLWSSDGSHPSLVGSYLTASVLFAAAFHESPLGADFTSSLSTENATYLQQVAAEVMAGEVSDIDNDGVLTSGNEEGFESGTLTDTSWVHAGDADWQLDISDTRTGEFSLGSGIIDDDQVSILSLDVDLAEVPLSFWYKVDSEEDYDFLRFYVDDELLLENSDKPTWTKFSTMLSAGSHTLTWIYSKDESESEGEDRAWVDDISIGGDNCPLQSNPGQLDYDDDGLGDVCDLDDDNDNVPDSDDAFDFDSTETLDTDGDGIGNNADSDDDNDGLPDNIEMQYAFLNPLIANDAEQDQDFDGYSNLTEYHALTDLNDAADPAYILDGFNGYYKLVKTHGSESEFFGRSVAIDGTTALICGSNSETAYIYTQSGNGDWVLESELNLPNGETTPLGNSLAIHNGIAVIGAVRDEEKGYQAGAAYVFEQDSEGAWVYQQKLTPPLANEAKSLFGNSVAVLNDTIVVGAYGDKFGSDLNNIGSSYIFTKDDGGTWNQQSKLIASNGGPTHRFGSTVALQSDRIVIGSVVGVYIFTPDENGIWVEQTIINQDFGMGPVIYQDTLVMSSSHDNDQAYNSGAVLVYNYNGAGDWSLSEKLYGSNFTEGGKFGTQIAIDGNTLLVSNSPSDSDSDNYNSVYVFEYNGTNWVEQSRLSNPASYNDELGASFGLDLAISGDTAIIGAMRDDDNGSNAGAVYFYRGLLLDR